MHIQVIIGNGPNGETFRLRHIKGLQDWLGDTAKTVHAEGYGAAGLVEILEVRAVTEGEILVLDCSRDQIQAVLEWQSAMDDVDSLEHVVIHLVRSAQSPMEEL
jgi:hypothetical protein